MNNLYHFYSVALPILDALLVMCELVRLGHSAMIVSKVNLKEDKTTCERKTKLHVKVMSKYPTTRHDIVSILHACSDGRDTILCTLILSTSQLETCKLY